ncbi:hypothetical protein [Leptospira johnsonii]|uniref:Uncharacterized protein n=1 Tax=Leptospira johnsonii TaxID=1917820 RepID=A0A2P2CZQ1_9LEPT|nr:hypothetical protein [Leptospira johnsonii]GBF37878.1 hypothetical protein LPTSP1_08660 [Leptospira johnsonii]
MFILLNLFPTENSVVLLIFIVISLVLVRVVVGIFSPNLEILITDEKFLYKQYSKNRILSLGNFSKDEIKSVYLQYYQLMSTIALETISGKVIWFECFGWDKDALNEIKEKLNDKRGNFSFRLTGILLSRFLLQFGTVCIIAYLLIRKQF